MSNNQVKQGFGNVQDVDRSGIHPEVKRRKDEINQIALSMTDKEKEFAIMERAALIWDRLNSADYWDEKENPKKVEK